MEKKPVRDEYEEVRKSTPVMPARKIVVPVDDDWMDLGKADQDISMESGPDNRITVTRASQDYGSSYGSSRDTLNLQSNKYRKG